MSSLGKYIVLEGGDGTGKSTQIKEMQSRLNGLGIKSIAIHEPDGFSGDESLGIPAVMADTELTKIIKNDMINRDSWSNVLLFTAARRMNWLQAMKPALDSGVWVLAARSWISTIAYQGYGEGVEPELIRHRTIEDVCQRYTEPDLALILTMDDEVSRQHRIDERGQLANADTFESKPAQFQHAVLDGYLAVAEQYNLQTIDASQPLASVTEQIWEAIKPLTQTTSSSDS